MTFRTQARTGRRGARSRAVLAFARVMVIALSSFSATIGLVIVFFVIFPALVTGLLAFAIAQVFGERGENQAYLARRRTHRP